MITIHTLVTNPMYFLIIKLYKVILYLYYIFTHITVHTNNITTNNNNNNNNTRNQYQTHTHTHTHTQPQYKFIIKRETLTTHKHLFFTLRVGDTEIVCDLWCCLFLEWTGLCCYLILG